MDEQAGTPETVGTGDGNATRPGPTRPAAAAAGNVSTSTGMPAGPAADAALPFDRYEPARVHANPTVSPVDAPAPDPADRAPDDLPPGSTANEDASGPDVPAGGSDQPTGPAAAPADVPAGWAPVDRRPVQPQPEASPHQPGVASQPIDTDQPEYAAGDRRRRSTHPAALLIGCAMLAAVTGAIAGATFATVPAAGPVATESVVNVVAPLPRTAVPADWVELVSAKLQPSVVSISVRDTAGEGTGSGVALTADGYVLTNAHVAGTGQDMLVRLANGDTVPATLVGSDPVYDVAVVKVDRTLPAATFNTGDVHVGEPVAAFGSPLGLVGTVTSGIISAVSRPVTAGGNGPETSIISAMQTDAAVNPGNSGGPLVNAAGEVIGLNSAIATMGSDQAGSIGLGFAIPSRTAVRVARELIATGKATRPLLGVSVEDAVEGGARVRAVTPGGPAETAGVRAGDLITAVDGVPVDSSLSAVALIRAAVPGDVIQLRIQRGTAAATTVDVTSRVESSDPLQTEPVTPTPAPSSSAPPSGTPSGPATPQPSSPAAPSR